MTTENTLDGRVAAFDGEMPTFIEKLCQKGQYREALDWCENVHERIIVACECGEYDDAKRRAEDLLLDEESEVEVYPDFDSIIVETTHFRGFYSVDHSESGPLGSMGTFYHKETDITVEKCEVGFEKALEAADEVVNGESRHDAAKAVWSSSRGV